MENSFSSNSITIDHIATKFGTCHDSPAVVPCAKFCSDHFISTWMRAKWNFHHIWIVMEKSLVKWAPVPNDPVLALKRKIPISYASASAWKIDLFISITVHESICLTNTCDFGITHRYPRIRNRNNFNFRHRTCNTSGLKPEYSGPTYKYLSALMLFQMLTSPLLQIKLHLPSTVLLNAFQSFKIHWTKQHLVNFKSLAGIVNATV